MEKICKNCRWWSKDFYSSGGDCDKIESDDIDKHGLSIKVEHGYDYVLLTSPKFGCIHWEEDSSRK